MEIKKFEKGLLHLYQGDCNEVLESIEKGSMDSIIIDPPYGYNEGALDGALNSIIDVSFDREGVYTKLTDACKQDASFVVFGRGMNLYKDAVILENLGWKFKEEIVWNKMRNSQPYMKMHRTHELALVFMKGVKNINEVWMRDYYDNVPNNTWYFEKLKADYKSLVNALSTRNVEDVLSLIHEKKWKQSSVYVEKPGFFHGKRNVVDRSDMDIYGAYKKRLKSVINVSRPINSIHSTAKPVYLMRCLVEMVTNEGDKVLDCFMGSGATGQAAIECGREFFGIEINSKYFDYCNKTLFELLKQKEGSLF